MIELGGGRDLVLSRARRALANKDFQWAAELTDYVLAIDDANDDAKRLKAAALSELGERQISAIARNYYLSAAQYIWCATQPPAEAHEAVPRGFERESVSVEGGARRHLRHTYQILRQMRHSNHRMGCPWGSCSSKALLRQRGQQVGVPTMYWYRNRRPASDGVQNETRLRRILIKDTAPARS